MRPSVVAVALLPHLVACSSGSRSLSDSFTTLDFGDSTQPTDSDTGSSTTQGDAPTWWSFDGTVTVTGGVPDAAASNLLVSLWDADVALMCQLDVTFTALADATDGPSDALAFWRGDVDDGVPQGEPCPTWASRALWIGLGPYDPALDVVAFEHGWDGSTVYSLLVRELEGGTVWTVGLGGTADQWAGTTGPVAKRPVDDGAYELHAVYLLQVP